ncbi:Lactation elevated protein 1 [Hordeum vulgare]|nr:Lactation elevated protein 1 [Hordeum vulgare]
MEASQPADLVNVEVAHAQSRPTDLVAGYVAPAVAQGTNAPTLKRQGNIVVQGGIPVGPVGREGASGVAAAARSAWPPAGKMSKVSGMKRKKVPTKKPSSPPSARRDVPRRCLSTALLPPQARCSMKGSEACFEQVRNAPPSGTLESDYEKIAQQWYKDKEAFEGKKFKLEHCWEMLKNFDKWKLIDKESPPKRGSLTKMDEDEDDDGPRNLNKLDGDKKTKEKIKREHEASTCGTR